MRRLLAARLARMRGLPLARAAAHQVERLEQHAEVEHEHAEREAAERPHEQRHLGDARVAAQVEQHRAVHQQ
eukprot:2860840-Prymnesium_polylepis.1